MRSGSLASYRAAGALPESEPEEDNGAISPVDALLGEVHALTSQRDELMSDLGVTQRVIAEVEEERDELGLALLAIVGPGPGGYPTPWEMYHDGEQCEAPENCGHCRLTAMARKALQKARIA